MPGAIQSASYEQTFSTTAFAEDAEEQPSERQVVYKQRTEIDFEGIEIEGALVRPQGALVLDRRRGSFNPLIQLREDFDSRDTSFVVHSFLFAMSYLG